jgi:hypothetical protein
MFGRSHLMVGLSAHSYAAIMDPRNTGASRAFSAF